MSDDPYLYAGTNVLKNKLGIDDQIKLNQIEYDLSAARVLELRKNPIEGVLDYKHLCEIHKYIFQDIYEWAGEPRIIGVSKAEPILNGESINYPHPKDHVIQERLDSRANYAFSQLAKDNYLKELDAKKFTDLLVYHATEMWEVHPFREGNTRTTLMFIDQLAREAGYELKQGFSLNIGEVREAFVLATAMKSQKLRRLFNIALDREFINQIAELKQSDPKSYQKLSDFSENIMRSSKELTQDPIQQAKVVDKALKRTMEEFRKGKDISNITQKKFKTIVKGFGRDI